MKKLHENQTVLVKPSDVDMLVLQLLYKKYHRQMITSTGEYYATSWMLTPLISTDDLVCLYLLLNVIKVRLYVDLQVINTEGQKVKR